MSTYTAQDGLLGTAVDVFAGAALVAAAWHLATSVALTAWCDWLMGE